MAEVADTYSREWVKNRLEKGGLCPDKLVPESVAVNHGRALTFHQVLAAILGKHPSDIGDEDIYAWVGRQVGESFV